MSLRVLCVTPMYPEVHNPAFGCFVQALNQALERQGLTVDVVRRGDGKRGVLSYVGLLWRALARGLRGPTPDVVHGHYLGPAAAIAVLVARLRGRPVVLTAHGSDVESAQSPPLRDAMALLLRSCDGLHLVSRALEARALELVGELPRHRLARGIGVDGRRFTPAPLRALGRPARLLMVARLVPEKGWLEALAALALLGREGHEAVLLACGDGNRSWLERGAAAEGVRERVELLGFRHPDALLALYRDADVVLVPSRREGFGLVGLEAMAAGTPVVSTGAGGLGDYMRDDVNALVVPPENPGALAAAVVRILGDEALRHRLRVEGLATAARYDVAATAAALARFYVEAGARPSATRRETRP
jgi:glycosyltransferase involved in cell wall biosynthesis